MMKLLSSVPLDNVIGAELPIVIVAIYYLSESRNRDAALILDLIRGPIPNGMFDECMCVKYLNIHLMIV